MSIAPIGVFNKNNFTTFSKTSNLNFKSTYNSKETNQEGQMENLEFKRQSLKFSDEDVKKMKSMTLKDKIDYVLYLKSQGLYMIENDKDEN